MSAPPQSSPDGDPTSTCLTIRAMSAPAIQLVAEGGASVTSPPREASPAHETSPPNETSTEPELDIMSTASDHATFINQHGCLLSRANWNARAVMSGEFDKIKRPYQPSRAPIRPEHPNWKRLIGLQNKFVRWDFELKACKTDEAREELSYEIIMECRQDFPKIANKEFEEPDIPESMRPRDATPTPEPEEPTLPEAATLPVMRPFVAAPSPWAPAAQAQTFQAPMLPVQPAQQQSVELLGFPVVQGGLTAQPHVPNYATPLEDDEEDSDRRGIKRERDDDYDRNRSPTPASYGGRVPVPQPGLANSSKSNKKRQRTEDFGGLMKSEDLAELRYLRKRTINKHERKLMKIDRQLEQLGAEAEVGAGQDN